MNNRVVMLGSAGESTYAMYNYLMETIGPFPLILEEPLSAWKMLYIRYRKVGLVSLTSQVLFMFLVRPILSRNSALRRRQILDDNRMDISVPPEATIKRVNSVNDLATLHLLRGLAPDVIVVNGTRIISKRVLESSKAIFINTHCGITPKYRGAHGGYWALYNNEPDKCGVTIHLVDAGIDTGEVIVQKNITPSVADCLVTYPLLQISAARSLMLAAVNNALAKKIEKVNVRDVSSVWYHPGLFQYVFGFMRGIK